MSWHSVIEKDLVNGTIRELYLYKLPLLKTCDNWKAVKEVGRIIFEGKHAVYRGALVLYAQKYYFVPDTRIQALLPFRKWDLRKKIKVITEEKHKEMQKK